MEKKLRRAVFLDRDGTLNRLVYYHDHGIVDSPFLPSQLVLLPGAAKAVNALHEKGFFLVLVSNQPGIAKGNITRKNFAAIDKKLDSLLARGGAVLDAKFYCIHHPNAKVRGMRKKCACRKPGAGMLLQAAKKYGIALRLSYMVGDGINDMEAGRKAGCKTVFIGAFKPELWKYFRGGRKPDIIVKNIVGAAKRIM